jgi:hypothetical protein
MGGMESACAGHALAELPADDLKRKSLFDLASRARAQLSP